MCPCVQGDYTVLARVMVEMCVHGQYPMNTDMKCVHVCTCSVCT